LEEIVNVLLDFKSAEAQFSAVSGITQHIIMNTKYNNWFKETAADPVRRRAAIGDYSRQRTVMICCALVASAAAVAMFFTATHSPKSPALLTFSAAMLWINVVRVDSRCQILTLLEKFSQREKPAA